MRAAPLRAPLSAAFVLAFLVIGGCRKAPVATVETNVAPPPSRESAPQAPPKDSGVPPTPRMLPDEQHPDVETVRAELRAAQQLVLDLADRPLDERAAETKAAAEGFLQQAEQALERGDITRTAVLVEKARILLDGLVEGDR